MTWPPPPRELSRRLELNIVFGSPLLLVAATLTLLAALMLSLLFMVYDVGFRSLADPSREVLKVESQIGNVAQHRLAGGGSVTRLEAGVKVNDETVIAIGYGQATVGDPVTIIVPISAPSRAWLEGHKRYPESPSTLIRVPLAILVLSLGIALLSFYYSRRLMKLLAHGEVVKGTRRRSIPLLRPLKDKELVCWEHDDRRFWRLETKGSKGDSLVRHKKIVSRADDLFFEITQDGQKLDGGRQTRRLSSALLVSILALTLLLVLAFFLT